MRLHFLGTGAGMPSMSRNVSAIALSLVPEIGQIWLFDVGEGTQHRIQRSSAKAHLVTRVFVTHLHGDHLFGLPGLLSSRGFEAGPATDVDVYGPPGIATFVQTCLEVSSTRLAFAVRCHELTGGEVIAADGFEVTALPLDHVVPCLGYRVAESARPGELRVDRLLEAGIRPGHKFADLKAGRVVTIGGRRFDGRDYLGPERPGRVIAYTGDTRPCANTVELARDADFLIHEATFGDDHAGAAAHFGHSTFTQAAGIARDARVRRLLVTHISARYSDSELERLVADAQSIFPETAVVCDMDEVDVPRR